MFEKIIGNGRVLAMIIRSEYKNEGITFFTPDEYSQQLAYMSHPKGKKIIPHLHHPVKREVQYTNEVLIIKKGKLQVDFFNRKKEYLESRILNKGDVILLIEGGHGFVALEDLEMVEVKQGPYAGDRDKERFDINIKKYVWGENYE